MMKGLLIQQQQQQQVVMDQENMSNLTCASGDQGSASSDNINIRADQDHGTTFPQHYFASNSHHDHPLQSQPPLKKKRNLPGNPDPEAEVVALSPKTLMATNRFVCEVCNKGFQRDQNLQLHRRGHNLPWKLKQRSSKEVVRKKVYVCPEQGCVHHEGGRALGDLTGIKKHYSRKHGEKKWKCDKCSKRYAVQSDWKAHSKTCGTREYRCDCGTLFSRRDSFITHRAFCDALAEESARAVTGLNPALVLLHQQQAAAAGGGATTGNFCQVQQPQPQPQLFSTTIDFNPTTTFSLKKEQHVQHFPPWLTSPPPPPTSASGPSPGPGPGPLPPSSSQHNFLQPQMLINTRFDHQNFTQQHQEQEQEKEKSHHGHGGGNPNMNPSGGGPTMLPPPYHQTTTGGGGGGAAGASAHMSATALLQKAAQMGATASSSSSSNSSNCTSSPMTTMIPRGPHHHQAHVPANSSASTMGFGLYLSSRDHLQLQGQGGPLSSTSSYFQDMLMMNALSSGIGINDDQEEGSTAAFEDAMVNGFLDHAAAKKEEISAVGEIGRREKIGGNVNGGLRGGNDDEDGMTRDFLGLTVPLSHADIMTMAAGLSNSLGGGCQQHESSQTPTSW